MTAISATVPTPAPTPVPVPARRVSPLSGMRNTFTLTWRSVLKIRTNMEDVIGLSLQPVMFLLLFTYVFGGAIAHGSTHDYLQYELPGLLVMTVVFATLGTGLMLNQGRIIGPEFPGQRAGRDDTPGVQREQSEQDPQLAAADVDWAPRLVPHLKRAQ
jgi:hypothetical protein